MTDVGDLFVQISERRRELDQAFYNELRELRRTYGDRAVDQALCMWQQQRDQVAVAKSDDWRHERRGAFSGRSWIGKLAR